MNNTPQTDQYKEVKAILDELYEIIVPNPEELEFADPSLGYELGIGFEKAKQSILALIQDEVRKGRIGWLDEQIAHVLQDIYPTDVFTKPTKEDFERINAFDANLNTRLHCDGIRHGLHILRREVRGLSPREDLEQLSEGKG